MPPWDILVLELLQRRVSMNRHELMHNSSHEKIYSTTRLLTRLQSPSIIADHVKQQPAREKH